jgi:hypothetical protein
MGLARPFLLKSSESGHGLERGNSRGKIVLVRRGSLIVRSIWAACLLVAGANHARALLQHGLFWDYGEVGWGSAAYWTSLTILDPIAAALLFVRPKAGIVLTIAIIVTNVVHNLTLTTRYAPDGELLSRVASSPFLLSQIGFMLFVGATARIAWNGLDGSGGRTS